MMKFITEKYQDLIIGYMYINIIYILDILLHIIHVCSMYFYVLGFPINILQLRSYSFDECYLLPKFDENFLKDLV